MNPVGACKTKIDGKYWCYVDNNSGCNDVKGVFNGEYRKYSFDACPQPVRNEYLENNPDIKKWYADKYPAGASIEYNRGIPLQPRAPQ